MDEEIIDRLHDAKDVLRMLVSLEHRPVELAQYVRTVDCARLADACEEAARLAGRDRRDGAAA